MIFCLLLHISKTFQTFLTSLGLLKGPSERQSHHQGLDENNSIFLFIEDNEYITVQKEIIPVNVDFILCLMEALLFWQTCFIF